MPGVTARLLNRAASKIAQERAPPEAETLGEPRAPSDHACAEPLRPVRRQRRLRAPAASPTHRAQRIRFATRVSTGTIRRLVNRISSQEGRWFATRAVRGTPSRDRSLRILARPPVPRLLAARSGAPRHPLRCILAHVGIVPRASPVYEAIEGPVLSLAIVFLLFSVNLADPKRAGPVARDPRLAGAHAAGRCGWLSGLPRRQPPRVRRRVREPVGAPALLTTA